MGLEEEKRKLQLKKQKLKITEQIIKERERRSKIHRYSEIGRLAQKAEIDMMDHSILLGAFLEIAEKLSDPNAVNQWKEKAKVFQQKAETSEQNPLVISFYSKPSQEIKSVLKENKFRWNSFRGEYYGLGKKERLEKLLSNENVIVKEISR